jgi:hypothetical protein
MKQNSSSNKTKIIIVAISLGIFLIILGILVGLLLRRSGFQFSLSGVQTQATPTLSPASIAPTLLIPTATCESQTFVLGTITFQVQNLTFAPDGSLPTPPTTSGVAYWLDTTEGNHIVLLTPTPENISLETTLTPDSSAKVIWTDCSSMTFSLSSPESNPTNISALLNQLTSGLTIFFQIDTSGNGFIVRGELAEMTFPQ